MDKHSLLTQLGFLLLTPAGSVPSNVPPDATFFVPGADWRYRHNYKAKDETSLYVYSWVHEPGFMLTTKENIGSLHDIVAELTSDDASKLALAVNKFFSQHGGKSETAMFSSNARTD